MKTIRLLVIALALAAPAAGQTIAGDRFTLNTGPCTIRSGAGAPEGAVTGKVCDIYLRIDGSIAGVVYIKADGSGLTGWQAVTPGTTLPIDPNPGKVLVSGPSPAWSPSPALTSITSLAGTNLTINGAQHLILQPAYDLYLQPAQHLAFYPTGVIVTNPGGRAIYPAVGYNTQIGLINSKYLAIHAAELWVESLVAQQTMATIGGRVLVAPTNILARDVAADGGPTIIYVKYPSFQLHVPGVELGSKLFLESQGKFEAMTVIEASTPGPQADGSYGYTVFRDQDGSGANAWYAGDAILDTGKATGGAVSGMIDLFAVRGVLTGAGPAIVGSVRTGQGYADIAPRFAIGNLKNVGYGHVIDVYGIAAGDPNGPNFFADSYFGLHFRQGTNPFISLFPDGRVVIRGDGNGVTNINGGNIAADTITGAQIAANSISVGDINATGFGDNLIKNGNFEPATGQPFGDAAGTWLSGWVRDPTGSTGTAEPSNQCCGRSSPGTLLLDPGNGNYMSVLYQAVPVVAGQVYRIAMEIYAPISSAVAFHVLVREYGGGAAGPGVRRVYGAGTGHTWPDVDATSQTFQAINAPITGGGWYRFEELYTVPAGVNWVSLNIFNLSGSVAGSVYTPLYFDAVEMQAQIGTGHIRANAITANLIAAGAVTAGKIAARSITANEIAVGTISATEIGARAISADRIAVGALTSTEIAARAITGDRIVAGAITGTEIAASTIGADKISVGALSAISANLGTVNAGTINGVTINGTVINGSTMYAGGTVVRLDGDGLTIGVGTSGPAAIKIGDSQMFGYDGKIEVNRNFQVDGGLTAGSFSTSGAISSQSNITTNATVDATTIVSRNMSVWGAGVRAVYFNYSCSCFGFWTGAALARSNVQAWAPADPLAILRAPLVSYASGAERELGLSVEGLAAILPEAVVRDAAGRPDTVRSEAVIAALLRALVELDRRIKALEAKGGGV